MAVFELPTVADPNEPLKQSTRTDPFGSEVAVRNVLWFISLRWIVVGVLLAAELAAWTVGPALHSQGLQIPNRWPWILALVLTCANVCFRIHARKLTPRAYIGSGIYLNLWTQIVVDLIALTVVVHYLGSLTTFICFAYLFHTVLACIFFPPRHSLVVTILACLLYIGCVAVELANIIPPAGIYATDINYHLLAGLLDSPLRISMHVGSAVGIFLVVWYLASNLSASVRRKDHQLLIAHQRLLASDRERTQHMLHTTHELKAPFAAIQSYVQLLLKGYCGPLTDDARQVLTKIDARSQRLSNQIREMLQLANLRSASVGDHPRSRVDLSELLGRAISSTTALARAREIRFEVKLQPALTEGVADQLEMMLANILANAVQYSHPGQTVKVSCLPLSHRTAQVQIADQGIGIRAEVLPHIFEEYYRSKEAAEFNPMCTGLGLAIVQHIAQTHGVAIHVESQPNQGTTFTLTFSSAKAQALPGGKAAH